MERLGKIKGKTLEVYYYLVDNPRKIRVREIQRALGYNLSSVAAYHLNRLYEYNLVGKTENGKYNIEGDPVKLGALEEHINIAGHLVPRIVIYGLQAILSIITGIILYVTEVEPIFWLLYIIINALVVIRVIIDSRDITEKLQVSQN